MAWIFLVVAGLMEVLWSTSLKLSHGFTQLWYSVLTVAGMVVSFLFLAQAMKTLPLGTAYAMWTGIGAVGAVIVMIGAVFSFTTSCRPDNVAPLAVAVVPAVLVASTVTL